MNKLIESFKIDLIHIIEKDFLFSPNTQTTRNNLAAAANQLFERYVVKMDVPDSIRQFKFFDNTSKYEDIDRDTIVLMVKVGNKELTVTEFLEKLETYLNK